MDGINTACLNIAKNRYELCHNFPPFACLMYIALIYSERELGRLDNLDELFERKFGEKTTTNYMSRHYACHCIDLQM